jgi:hypothetical protein
MISLWILHRARNASDKSYREVQNKLFVSYTFTKLCAFARYLQNAAEPDGTQIM